MTDDESQDSQDRDAIRDAMRGVLRIKGTSARLAAAKAAAARQLTQTRPPDVTLPDVDGWPADPLLERYPDPSPDAEPDPFCDMDFEAATGRPPHPGYLRVMRACGGCTADEMLAAEATWLQRCEARGLKP